MTRTGIDGVVESVKKMPLPTTPAFFVILRAMRNAPQEERETLKSVFRKLGKE